LGRVPKKAGYLAPIRRIFNKEPYLQGGPQHFHFRAFQEEKIPQVRICAQEVVGQGTSTFLGESILGFP